MALKFQDSVKSRASEMSNWRVNCEDFSRSLRDKRV